MSVSKYANHCLRNILPIGLLGKLLLFVVFVASCNKKESELIASGQPVGYQLPQGNQDFDQEIVDIHRKYGTYILYKFQLGDFQYTVNDRISDIAEVPELEHVRPAFKFLKQNLLDFYSDSVLKTGLPYKIILASKVDSLIKSVIVDNEYQRTYMRSLGFNFTNSMFSFAWANEEFGAMDAGQLRFLKGKLHETFWLFMILHRGVKRPTNYAALMQSTASLNQLNRLSRGYLKIPRSNNTSLALEYDVASYIEIITSYTEAEIEAEFLSPTVDTGGWIRKKYNLVRSFYLQNYNIDLQAIGNTAVK